MTARIERRAAELAQSARDARASWRYRRALARWSADENRGWRAHLLGVAAEHGRSRAWLAGWLGREIWTHEQEPSVSERIITGRDKFGRGGQHAVNGSTVACMVLVIDDQTGLGVYCATGQSAYANLERARGLLAMLNAAQVLAEAWTSGALQDRSRIADALNALAALDAEARRG